MLKNEIRNSFHKQRIALSKELYKDKCFRLSNRFFNDLNLQSIKVLHIFLSIDKNKEPDTWLIINQIQSNHPHIKLVVPRVNVQDNQLENFYLDSIEQLVTNEWGIPEPVTGKKTPIEEIDIVLVPLLAFDIKGNRVGYGKGFYDKFLSQCPLSTKRIGLSLFGPVDQIDDVDEFDVPLHFCITPEKVYAF